MVPSPVNTSKSCSLSNRELKVETKQPSLAYLAVSNRFCVERITTPDGSALIESA